MVSNRAIAVAGLLGGVLSILVAISQQSLLLVAISASFFALSIVVWRYGYLIIPLITRATNIVEVRGNYTIPSSRDYVLAKSGSGYLATKFLELRFYESSQDKESEAKHHMFESFEKAISSLKYIVKISMMVSPIDLSADLDELKTKRSVAEAKRAKISDSGDITKLDREIAYYNRLIDRLSHGEKSVELLAYASTTAFGLTREDAVSRANRQTKEVKTILVILKKRFVAGIVRSLNAKLLAVTLPN